MRHYKMISDGYITAIGVGVGGEEITESQYNSIMEIIHNRPISTVGYEYRLTNGLKWELHELHQEDQEEEATAEDYEAALTELGVSE